MYIGIAMSVCGCILYLLGFFHSRRANKEMDKALKRIKENMEIGGLINKAGHELGFQIGCVKSLMEILKEVKPDSSDEHRDQLIERAQQVERNFRESQTIFSGFLNKTMEMNRRICSEYESEIGPRAKSCCGNEKDQKSD